MALKKEKTGIDYIEEAKDFTNIINNLKGLLLKGDSLRSKSYMTLQQNPNSTKNFSNINNMSHSNVSSITGDYLHGH